MPLFKQRALGRTVFLATLSACLAVGCTSPLPNFTELVAIPGGGNDPDASAYVLPGAAEPSPDAVYRIDSDLPARFRSPGVLYTTRATLPEFHTAEGEPVPIELRRQANHGFTAIDGDFDVMLCHLYHPDEGQSEQQVVVYASNTGKSWVTVTPRSIMESLGFSRYTNGPESRLAMRMMTDQWDWSPAIEIPPGQGRLLAVAPKLKWQHDGLNINVDASPNHHLFGWMRASVEAKAGGKPQLEVAAIAIDARTPADDIAAACEALLNTGADSAERSMDLSIAPPASHLRRAVGVSKAFLWRSETVTLNASAIPFGDTGMDFLMAAPALQTAEFPQARQTGDKVLFPGYVHGETIGNYQVEYLTTFELVNPSPKPVKIDLRFGRHTPYIGLAWQVRASDQPATRDELRKLPVHVQWAGYCAYDSLPDDTASMLHPLTSAPHEPLAAAPLTIEPGERVVVSLRFMPVISSAQPFRLHVMRMD